MVPLLHRLHSATPLAKRVKVPSEAEPAEWGVSMYEHTRLVSLIRTILLKEGVESLKYRQSDEAAGLNVNIRILATKHGLFEQLQEQLGEIDSDSEYARKSTIEASEQAGVLVEFRRYKL